jgi:hypothetical protein
MIARRIVALGGLLSLLGTLWHSAAGAAEIVVTWTSVLQEVRPQQGLRRSSAVVRLTLQGGNVITERAESMNLRGQRLGSTRHGQLRSPLPISSLGRPAITWRVQDARRLVRTVDASQHTMTLRVTTTAASSCRASISYRLKPGFREYRVRRISNGEPMFVSSIRAEDIACRVAG